MTGDENFELEATDRPMSAGELLADERKKQGLTIEYISEKLHLKQSVISAIESDDYSAIPGLIYARGYVQAYARLLKLSEEDVLIAFSHVEWKGKRETDVDTLAASSPMLTMQETPMRKRFASEKRQRRRHGLAVVVVVILVLLSVFFWRVKDVHHQVKINTPATLMAVPATHYPKMAVQSDVKSPQQGVIQVVKPNQAAPAIQPQPSQNGLVITKVGAS